MEYEEIYRKINNTAVDFLTQQETGLFAFSARKLSIKWSVPESFPMRSIRTVLFIHIVYGVKMYWRCFRRNTANCPQVICI